MVNKPEGQSNDPVYKQTEDHILAERLDSLSRKLAEKDSNRTREGGKQTQQGSGSSAMSGGLRLSGEFIAGVVTGGAIGWAVDRYLGFSPWGLITFLMLGFATGVWNVLRAAGYIKPPERP